MSRPPDSELRVPEGFSLAPFQKTPDGRYFTATLRAPNGSRRLLAYSPDEAHYYGETEIQQISIDVAVMAYHAEQAADGE